MQEILFKRYASYEEFQVLSLNTHKCKVSSLVPALPLKLICVYNNHEGRYLDLTDL